jgi:hypothetical protein
LGGLTDTFGTGEEGVLEFGDIPDRPSGGRPHGNQSVDLTSPHAPSTHTTDSRMSQQQTRQRLT